MGMRCLFVKFSYLSPQQAANYLPISKVLTPGLTKHQGKVGGSVQILLPGAACCGIQVSLSTQT